MFNPPPPDREHQVTLGTMSSTTEKDLEDMGLVQTSPGIWVPKKTAKKVEKIKADNTLPTQGNPKELVIDGPPTYRVIKDKKYYLSGNLFYSSIHWTIRKNITIWAKGFLKERMLHLKPLEPRTTLLVVFSVKREITPNMNLDVDNRCGFWAKMFQDVLEDLGLVTNDNAYWISKVHYEFDWKRKEDNLTFKIL